MSPFAAGAGLFVVNLTFGLRLGALLQKSSSALPPDPLAFGGGKELCLPDSIGTDPGGNSRSLHPPDFWNIAKGMGKQ